MYSKPDTIIENILIELIITAAEKNDKKSKIRHRTPKSILLFDFSLIVKYSYCDIIQILSHFLDDFNFKINYNLLIHFFKSKKFNSLYEKKPWFHEFKTNIENYNMSYDELYRIVSVKSILE